MYMRYFLMFFTLSSCTIVSSVKPPKSAIPDKEFKEIAVHGRYYPKEEEKINTANYSPELAYSPFHRLSNVYCYNQTKEKKPVYDEGLRLRLYDKKGNRIAEDFLR